MSWIKCVKWGRNTTYDVVGGPRDRFENHCFKARYTLCDFFVNSSRYQLALYKKIACDVKIKAHDLHAHTVRSDCRAQFMCSHYTCEILWCQILWCQTMTLYMNNSQKYLLKKIIIKINASGDLSFNVFNYCHCYYYYYDTFIIKCIGLIQLIWPSIIS